MSALFPKKYLKKTIAEYFYLKKFVCTLLTRKPICPRSKQKYTGTKIREPVIDSERNSYRGMK